MNVSGQLESCTTSISSANKFVPGSRILTLSEALSFCLRMPIDFKSSSKRMFDNNVPFLSIAYVSPLLPTKPAFKIDENTPSRFTRLVITAITLPFPLTTGAAKNIVEGSFFTWSRLFSCINTSDRIGGRKTLSPRKTFSKRSGLILLMKFSVPILESRREARLILSGEMTKKPMLSESDSLDLKNLRILVWYSLLISELGLLGSLRMLSVRLKSSLFLPKRVRLLSSYSIQLCKRC